MAHFLILRFRWPAIYRPRHPEKTVLGQVLFHHFEQFVAEYENRFERQYGFFRPIIKEAIERYLDCGNPRCRFAQIRCPDCGSEFLPHFSCRTRGVCPSCQAKPLEQWEEWLCEELLLDGPRRQVVFAIPKMLRRPGASFLFSGRGGENTRARCCRGHPDVRRPHQFPPASAFPCDRGRGG